MSIAKPEGTGRPVLVLFRNDFRLADNGALAAACETGKPVVPVFILDDSSTSRARGSASRWWLHHSLDALSKSFRDIGASLTICVGKRLEVIADLIDDTKADAVYWNRSFDPADLRSDAALTKALASKAVGTESFDGQLLHDPLKVKTGAGNPYKVYTPFWRALNAMPEARDPIDAPKSLVQYRHRIRSTTLEELGLLPTKPDWAGGLRERWTPGVDGARHRLTHFLKVALEGYGEGRDMPALPSTSMLSPHLAHGEITPFQILAGLRRSKSAAKHRADAEKFHKELCWREFNYHQLFHNPDLATRNSDEGFDAFPWSGTTATLSKWQKGLTGYPIVDAGMRELWQTGWMHNRVRLIVGSFLIKHLLTDWRKGEQWFWDTLVDADCANNPGNWQWVAGSGADASPYFRIFNPILQGEKFDRFGSYVRQYVPEIAALPDKFIHQPWTAPAAVLDRAGVKLGQTYPVPLIDHGEARERAMQAFRTMRGTQ